MQGDVPVRTGVPLLREGEVRCATRGKFRPPGVRRTPSQMCGRMLECASREPAA